MELWLMLQYVHLHSRNYRRNYNGEGENLPLNTQGYDSGMELCNSYPEHQIS